MGTASIPPLLRGLLVPDPRFRWDPDRVSATSQAGPIAGAPEAQRETEMLLEASGTQQADTILQIRSIQAGNPGTDDARFVWRYAGDTDWRGWDPPSSLTGFEVVEWSTTSGKWTHPHAIALKDGTILVACAESNRKVTVWRRDPDAGTWSSVEVYDRGSAYTWSPYPTLVTLDSGRVLCFFYTELTTGYQVRMYFSDDSGVTWKIGQRACMSAPFDTADYHPGRFRGAYLAGQVMLVFHLVEQATPEDQLHQYCSDDLGASFGFVSSLTGYNRGYPDCCVAGGRIYVGYVSNGATGGSPRPPKWRSVASASADLSSAGGGVCQIDTDSMEWGTESGGVFSSGGMAIWADDDGALWVAGMDQAGTSAEVLARVSLDDGETWRDVGWGPSPASGLTIWRGQDANTHPKPDLSVVAWRGRALMLHRFAASPGTGDGSLCAAWLGGYTTVCMPQEDSQAPSVVSVGGWTVTWLPYDLPEDVGDGVPVWAHTHTGASTLTGDGMHLTSAVGQFELFYTDAALPDIVNSTLAEGLMAQCECKVVSGTCRIELRISDATPTEYEVMANVTPTSIALYDANAGANVASVSTTAGATGVQLLLQVQNASAKLWYCPVGGSSRDFVLVAETTTLTSAAFNHGNRVRFGQSGAAESYWKMVCFTGDFYVWSGWMDQDNPADLFGRAYTHDVYVDGGTLISALDGPTFRNDEWHIPTAYTFGVENVFPDVAPSPRVAWRSVNDSSDTAIIWTLGDHVTATMGDLVGIYLGECNFATAELWAQEAGGGWVSIANLDLRAGTGLKWERADRNLRATTAAGGSVPFYLPTHTLAGCHVRLDNGFAYQVRKIETNSAGTWTGSGTSLRARVLLSEVDGTEPSSGSSAAIWAKDYAAIVPVTDVYKAWKLVIPAQDTWEGYFTIGAMVWGHIFPLGSYLMEYGWGRAIEWAYAFEQVEGRTGIRVVHDQGPTRRATEIAWVDGVETSGLQEGSPNWIVGWTTGGEPVAVAADLPYSLPGLMDSLQGATLPLVYLASFDVPTIVGDVVHVTDRRLLLYGRVMSESLRVDNVLGDEGRTELLRVGTCRFEEET